MKRFIGTLAGILCLVSVIAHGAQIMETSQESWTAVVYETDFAGVGYNQRSC